MVPFFRMKIIPNEYTLFVDEVGINSEAAGYDCWYMYFQTVSMFL